MSKEVSICVLLYGDYPALARRVLSSIMAHCDRGQYHLIVGANAISPTTESYVRQLHAEGAIDRLEISPKNLNKCPMMRRMLDGITTPYIWWFDDDSHIVAPNALTDRLAIAQSAPAHEVQWGHVFFFGHENDFSYGTDVRGFVKSAPWYRNLEPPSWEPGGKGQFNFEGKGTGDGRWFFVTGGNWFMRMDALRALDWPDVRMIKRSDDVFLAEAIRQQGWTFRDIGPLGVVINDAPRRGEGEDARTMHLQMAGGTPILDLGGWFDDEEAAVYHALASKVQEGVVVELGVWKGRSLAGILPVCAQNGNHVFAIDQWGTIAGDLLTDDSNTAILDIFKTNLKLLGHESIVTIIQSDTSTAAQQFEDGSVDLIFVDGDHSHEGVRKDLFAWIPKLKPEGVMFGHDYHWFEGVRTALAEVLPRRVALVGGSLWKMLPPWESGPAKGKGCIFIPSFEDTDVLAQNFGNRPEIRQGIDIKVYDDNSDPAESAALEALCKENHWEYHKVDRPKHRDWIADEQDLSGFNHFIWDTFTTLGLEYDYVLKLDTDALIVAPDFYLEFDRLLTGKEAVAGTLEIRASNQVGNFWELAAANGHPYTPPSHVGHMQGGIYGFSKAALLRLREMGFFKGPHRYFGDDPYLSFCCLILGIPFVETHYSGSWWHPYLPKMERLRHLRAVHPMLRSRWEAEQC